VEEKATELFNVSPNPSNGIFEFINKEKKEIELKVIDWQGRIVFNCKKEDSFMIDLTTYPSGTYVALIQSNQTMEAIRLVVL
jgi:hypothetical protein